MEYLICLLATERTLNKYNFLLVCAITLWLANTKKNTLKVGHIFCIDPYSAYDIQPKICMIKSHTLQANRTLIHNNLVSTQSFVQPDLHDIISFIRRCSETS